MSTNFENGDDCLRCVVGGRDYPAAKAMFKQAQDIAFHGVLDAITGFGPVVNPSAGFASTQDIGQYWAFAELPGSAPTIRFTKSLGARYADTSVQNLVVGAGPITISKLAIDRAMNNPLFMAHIIVHEMAHYLRWSQGTGNRSYYERDVIGNMGLESQFKYYKPNEVPTEGYNSELAVFGSVRDHD